MPPATPTPAPTSTPPPGSPRCAGSPRSSLPQDAHRPHLHAQTSALARTSPKPSPASPVTRSATCRPMRLGNIVAGGVGLDVEVVDRGHRHQRSRSAPASSRAKHAAHIQWSAMMPPLTDHDLAVVLPRLCAGGPQSAAPAARFLDDARAKRLPDTLPDGCRPRVAVVPTALRVRVRDEIGGLQES